MPSSAMPDGKTRYLQRPINSWGSEYVSEGRRRARGIGDHEEHRTLAWPNARLLLRSKSTLPDCRVYRDRERREPTYLVVRTPETVRASGLLGVQSSGGKATRQKVGRGAVNSRPSSPLPPRTGPRNATWHSCSSSVLLCRM